VSKKKLWTQNVEKMKKKSGEFFESSKTWVKNIAGGFDLRIADLSD